MKWWKVSVSAAVVTVVAGVCFAFVQRPATASTPKQTGEKTVWCPPCDECPDGAFKSEDGKVWCPPCPECPEGAFKAKKDCPPCPACPEGTKATAKVTEKSDDCCPSGETCPACARKAAAKVEKKGCCPPGETCPECEKQASKTDYTIICPVTGKPIKADCCPLKTDAKQ